MDNLDLKKLRKIIDDHPEILEKPKLGRKKGGKNEPVTIVATVQAPEAEVEEISYSKAKTLGISVRKPRQMTEEQKTKMLENLQKGREKLKILNEEKKRLKEEEAKKPKVREIDMVQDPKKPVKKYIIKPKRKHKKEQPKHEQEEI